MSMNERGFTLAEMIVVLATSLIFATLIIFFAFEFWQTAEIQQADQDTLISRLNAGDYVRENIGESSGLIIQNGLPDSHVRNADPAIASGLYWLPLHAVPKNIPVGASGTVTPVLYYKKNSVNTSKNLIMNGVVPYEDEYILYMDGTTKQLLSHTIANPDAPNNRAKSSCPPSEATESCPADKVVAEDISSIDTRYFSRTGTLLDYSSSTDPLTGEFNGPDYPLVEVLELTINLAVKPAFQKSASTQNSTIIRIALRNN